MHVPWKVRNTNFNKLVWLFCELEVKSDMNHVLGNVAGSFILRAYCEHVLGTHVVQVENGTQSSRTDAVCTFFVSYTAQRSGRVIFHVHSTVLISGLLHKPRPLRISLFSVHQRSYGMFLDVVAKGAMSVPRTWFDHVPKVGLFSLERECFVFSRVQRILNLNTRTCIQLGVLSIL